MSTMSISRPVIRPRWLPAVVCAGVALAGVALGASIPTPAAPTACQIAAQAQARVRAAEADIKTAVAANREAAASGDTLALDVTGERLARDADVRNTALAERITAGAECAR